jgi:hypothetical protein
MSSPKFPFCNKHAINAYEKFQTDPSPISSCACVLKDDLRENSYIPVTSTMYIARWRRELGEPGEDLLIFD